jgi:disulfide bond formation protein DsbB
MTARKALRQNSLSWFFGIILLLSLIGQAFTGVAEYNSQVVIDDLPQMGIGEYVTSSQFAVDVAENWQSEYLQFLLYIVLTVWLVQRGSPESKPVDERGGEDDQQQKLGAHTSKNSPTWARAGGWRTALYSNSLGLVVGLFFLGSWGAQLVAGTSAYNSERLQNLLAPISMPQYFVSANFWNRTLQNWQSEFLAVGTMIAFSIFLRQRGSSESKPVGTPHYRSAEDSE